MLTDDDPGGLTLAVLGGSGRIGAPFVRHFVCAGATTRVLTRRPERVHHTTPGAEPVAGSMMRGADVIRALEGADAAVLLTPIGPDDDPGPELQAATVALAAAEAAELPHLLYVSLIGIDQPTGVPMLDAKRQVEQILAAGTVPWSSLRTGSYMDDIIDPRLALLRRGLFFFPVPRKRRLSLTAQDDVARLALQLAAGRAPLNGSLDVIDPEPHTPAAIASLAADILGRPVQASGGWPLLALQTLRPLIRRTSPRLASIITLLAYFAHQDWTGDPHQLDLTLPGFQTTSLETHLRAVLREPDTPTAPGTRRGDPGRKTRLGGRRGLMPSTRGQARSRAGSERPARRDTAPGSNRTKPGTHVDLYWLPLGAGGHFVRLNGHLYEAAAARLARRPALDLYHSALEVQVPEGRFVIESAPIRPSDGPDRGVVAEGPVGSRFAGPLRIFRYELRVWRNGVIPDVVEAVESPQRLSEDAEQGRRLLALTSSVPTPVWGRDELDAGEMWNSNSFIAWLLARSGLDADAVQPPTGGRAPGWDAGLVVARRQLAGDTGQLALLVHDTRRRRSEARMDPRRQRGARIS
jgi:uncharacterized protein YbjT (DUF2867 family)